MKQLTLTEPPPATPTAPGWYVVDLYDQSAVSGPHDTPADATGAMDKIDPGETRCRLGFIPRREPDPN